MGSRFEQDTRVKPLDEASYEAHLDGSWWVPGGPNGGYVAAMLVRALRDRLPDAGALRSLDVSFPEAADEGPARVETTLHREAGAVVVAGGRLVQEDQTCVTARATFGPSGPGPSFLVDEPPTVPGPDQGHPIPESGPLEPPTFAQHCEFRIVGGAEPLAGSVGDGVVGWIRLSDPAPYDEALVTFLADAWMPAIFAVLDEPMPSPSLDMDLQLVPNWEDLAPEAFLLGVFRTEGAGDGFAFEDGTLWTPDGDLVARARQTQRVFPPR